MSLSPVFLYEAITASRRWQGYALRVLLVLAMLIALGVVWFAGLPRSSADLEANRQFLAKLGENFYYGAAGIQLALAFLVAPAATAGAVCVDRANGWLANMFGTELSNTEIVLGKLTARFAACVALVFASLPVLAIVGLLGGIIPEALMILTVVTLMVALLGCSLAMTLSVRASKSHEVLMVVFALWGVWLLSVPMWDIVARLKIVAGPPGWAFRLNPFVLAYAPYAWPGYVDGQDVAVFAAAACLLSLAAVVHSICRLRADLAAPVRESGRVRAWRGWAKAHLFSWWPSPSLDGNPVLWREWHRNRPSRMARLVTGIFTFGIVLAMGLGIADTINHGAGVDPLLEGMSFLGVTFGLLILSATAPTCLTEERARGSLDILLTTPLPTHAIVLGKWWATYRRALPLLILPALTGLFVAAASPDRPFWQPARLLVQYLPPTSKDRVIAGLLPSAFLLAHAAATTSIGLALATWLRRTGRAVAVSVTVFVAMAIGWFIAVRALIRPFLNWWSVHIMTIPDNTISPLEDALVALSPMAGQTYPFDVMRYHLNQSRDFTWRILFLELVFLLVVAAVLLGLTLLTFNRCLGRISQERTGWRAWAGGRRSVAPRPRPETC